MADKPQPEPPTNRVVRWARFADERRPKRAVPPVDSAAQRAAATSGSREQAGVRGETLPLFMPGDWTRLEFPLDQPEAALAFATAAFRYDGWPLLTRFADDFASAYRGIPDSVRGTLPSTAMLRRAIRQWREALAILRPRVTASLVGIEAKAVAVLGERLDTTVRDARAQAERLLVMPPYQGKPIDPGLFLEMRWRRGSMAAIRDAVTPVDMSRDAGKQFRALVDALAPAAAAFGVAQGFKEVADVRRTINGALRTAARTSPTLGTAGTAALDTAEAVIAIARESGKLAAVLQEATRKHEDVLDTWKRAQAAFATARRAAAGEFPVLHRFGYKDIAAAIQEDDAALGARILARLTPVHAAALGVHDRYVRQALGSHIKPKRPAVALMKALAGDDPPSDPVAFVMDKAKGSVWEHAPLIQATIEAMARGASTGGAFAVLDGFESAVSEQALAEGVRQETSGALRDAGVGLGMMAGLIALHFLAPPVAFIADAALATHDLTSSVEAFGSDSIESRCAFDPALSLAEEPSLAWFVASQAFNLVTVG